MVCNRLLWGGLLLVMVVGGCTHEHVDVGPAPSGSPPADNAGTAHAGDVDVELVSVNILNQARYVYSITVRAYNSADSPRPLPECSFVANSRQAARIQWPSDEPIAPRAHERVVGRMRFEDTVADLTVDDLRCNG